MKIGDKFKQGSHPSIYTLVRMGYKNEVYVFNATDNVIMSTFKGRVEDLENITKEEFRNILDISQEHMDRFENLDGSPLFPEETYTWGDVFEVIDDPQGGGSEGQKLMLCQVCPRKFCLVTITGYSRGNRWADPIETKSMTVTKEELKQMCGSAHSIVLKKVNE